MAASVLFTNTPHDSFQVTAYFPTQPSSKRQTTLREECILLQLLSSILVQITPVMASLGSNQRPFVLKSFGLSTEFLGLELLLSTKPSRYSIIKAPSSSALSSCKSLIYLSLHLICLLTLYHTIPTFNDLEKEAF